MTARPVSLIGAFVLAALALVDARQPAFDLVLRNGRVVDGAGSPWFRADVGVRGDTIVAVARSIDAPAGRIVDLAGQMVAPGFIDIHTHARRGLAQTPTADNYVRQGVTTVIEGPDGSSAVPLGPFLETMAQLQKSVNIGSFIGQGSIRAAVIGSVNRAATSEELARMVALADQGMKDGALGLSTGLFYVPGSFTPTSEVIELAKVAGRYGGIHQSHQRDDASKVLESVRETIAIGEGGGLATQVTHMKTVGQANWGKSVDALRLIDEARARGVDVTIDQYPYTASSTSVSAALLPAWALEGNRQAQLQRLDDPAARTKMKAESVAMIRDERGGGDAKNVQFANCGFDATLTGKTLADLVARRKLAPTLENAAEMVMWIHGQGGCQGIFHAMSEDDLVRILRTRRRWSRPMARCRSSGARTRIRAATGRSRGSWADTCVRSRSSRSRTRCAR